MAKKLGIMAPITWGLLEKNQIDPEKIEEAINRLIQNHLNDPEAHLGPGQSLQSHRAAEIIDHRAASIVDDKIKKREITSEKLSDFGRFRASISLETFDSWYLSNPDYFEIFFSQVYFYTTVTPNTERFARIELGQFPRWDKNFESQWIIKLGSNTNQIFYILVGCIPAIIDEAQSIGFKIVNNALYACHSKIINEVTVEYTTLITGVNINNYNLYRVEFVAGNRVDFYVNDVLRASHNSNLPDPYYYPEYPFFIYLKNTAGQNKWAYLNQIYLASDL